MTRTESSIVSSNDEPTDVQSDTGKYEGLVKFKPEYNCLADYDNKGRRRRYKAMKSDGSCFKCGGNCPYESECEAPAISRSEECRGILPNTEMRYLVDSFDHEHGRTPKKEKRTCSACLSIYNEMKVDQTKRANANPALNKSIKAERYQILLAKSLVRADELYGPDFGPQLLPEYHIRVIIDGQLVEQKHSTRGLDKRAQEWKSKIEGWLEICRILDIPSASE